MDSISSGSTLAGAMSVHTTSRGFKSFDAAVLVIDSINVRIVSATYLILTSVVPLLP